jgi:type II secretory pathway pseudopilin PulG
MSALQRQLASVLKRLVTKNHRNQQGGFTMAELAVGMVVTLSVGAMATSFIVRSNESFQEDSQKVEMAQISNSVIDLVSADIKRAGEMVNSETFPAIQLFQNVTESGKTYKFKLIVRRALSKEMPLCWSGVFNTTTNMNLYYSDVGTPNTTCKSFTYDSASAYPIDLQKWRQDNGRCKEVTPAPDYTSNTNPCTKTGLLAVHDRANGKASIYAYNGDERQTVSAPNLPYSPGEFNFRVTGTSFQQPATYGGSWFIPCPYLPASSSVPGAQIYTIEERAYYFDETEGKLWLSVNRDIDPDAGVAGAPKPRQLLADSIYKLNVSLATVVDTNQAMTAPGNLQMRTDFATYAETCYFPFPAADKWKTIRQVMVNAVMIHPDILQGTNDQGKRLQEMAALETNNVSQYNALKINHNIPLENATMDNGMSP